MYDEFERLDTVVCAIAQEDTDLESFAAMPKRFTDRFPILCDVDRQVTEAFDRTTAYLIDKRGVVREVFPMIIHARPSWKVMLAELERVEAEAAARKEQ